MDAPQWREQWREFVVLDDGRSVVLRLLQPSDREHLVAGFEELSPEARYRRFLYPKARLSAAELEYLTNVDQVSHVAIAALEVSEDSQQEGHGIGVCRYVAEQGDCRIADLAITIVDRAQGFGLGRFLLERLTGAALDRGVERFKVDILATNHAMLSLISRFPNQKRRISNGVIHLELDLR